MKHREPVIYHAINQLTGKTHDMFREEAEEAYHIIPRRFYKRKGMGANKNMFSNMYVH